MLKEIKFWVRSRSACNNADRLFHSLHLQQGEAIVVYFSTQTLVCHICEDKC